MFSSYITANKLIHGFRWWNVENFFSKIRNTIKVPSLTTPVQHKFGNASQNHQARKRNKKHSIRKEAVKLSLLADTLISYIKNLKDFTKKKTLLVLINKLNKVIGYSRIKKSVVSIYKQWIMWKINQESSINYCIE